MNELTIRESYRKIIPDLEKWGSIVDTKLIKVIKASDFEINDIKINPEYRTKSENSFISKVFYRDKKYSDFLIDVEDKVGTRLVVLKSDQVEFVSDLLLSNNSEWQIKETKRLNSGTYTDPKQFDYQSIHLVVWPDKDYGFETKNLEVLTCEVQVRSLLQHAFAEVSHDSTYKGPYKNDHEIIRRLAKSAALMEATDDYFCEIFDMLTDTERIYSAFLKNLREGYNSISDMPVENVDTVLADKLFELVSVDEIKNIELDEFLVKHGDDIQLLITDDSHYIFKQPIILLLCYLVIYDSKRIKDQFPFSEDILRTIFRKLGQSYEDF